MKCLEKDRTRRYDTTNGLAADLKRHLENEPVVARPPTAAYKLQKAFRRNKLAFAAAELLPLVYDELRCLAAHRLAGEAHAHTLQPTALVHEAWLKIAGTNERTWQGRQHFFAAAAEAMRRILVDRARRRLAAKRGGVWSGRTSRSWTCPRRRRTTRCSR